MVIPIYSARISDPLGHRRGYSPYMAHRRTASAARRNIWNNFLCSELEDLAIIHVLCHRSHPIHYNRHHRYNRHIESSRFRRTMNKKPNKRVQRTLHKVSGPLTRDVGATMIIEPINPKKPVVGDTANIRPAPFPFGMRDGTAKKNEQPQQGVAGYRRQVASA